MAAAALSADIVMENTGHVDIEVLGKALSFDIWGLFALGAVAGVVVVFGLQLTVHGIARSGQRRKQLRQLVRDAERDAEEGGYRSVSDEDEPVTAPARAMTGPYDRVVARVGGVGERRGERRGTTPAV
jgi:hypothetical protein